MRVGGSITHIRTPVDPLMAKINLILTAKYIIFTIEQFKIDIENISLYGT